MKCHGLINSLFEEFSGLIRRTEESDPAVRHYQKLVKHRVELRRGLMYCAYDSLPLSCKSVQYLIRIDNNNLFYLAKTNIYYEQCLGT